MKDIIIRSVKINKVTHHIVDPKELWDGRVLWMLRKQRNLSRMDLAYELRRSYDYGVCPGTIVNWEKNKTAPHLGDITVLAAFFKVKLTQFFVKKNDFSICLPGEENQGGLDK